MVTYRGDDPAKWGPGKGANLTAAEVDGNFWELAERILAMEENPIPGVSVSNVTVLGSQMTIHLSDGSVRGPFTLPTAMIHYRGEWAAGIAYSELDVVSAPDGSGIFLSLRDHTASDTFDRTAVDASGNRLYQWLFPSMATRLGSLWDVSDVVPTAGQALVWDEASGLWAPGEGGGGGASLVELSDVWDLMVPAMDQVLTFDGSLWYAADAVRLINDLDGVTVWQPQIGQVLTFSANGSWWRNEFLSFLHLLGTPAAYGTPGQVLAVNAAGDGMVFADLPSAPVQFTAFVAGLMIGGETLFQHVAALPFVLPIGLAGSQAAARVPAAAAVTLSVQKNGAEIGAIGFAAGAGVVTFTMSAEQSFIAGDVLSIVAPATADPDLSDTSFTILAS